MKGSTMSLCGEIENLQRECEQHIKALCDLQLRLSKLREIERQNYEQTKELN